MESEIVIVLIKSPKKENKIISVQHSIAFIVLRRHRLLIIDQELS